MRLVGLANGASNESASACLLLESLAGIIIANASHYLSVLVLYRLSWHLWRDDKLALVAAILHLVSPAGLFLSAPYGESGFALLSFVGYYLLARSHAGSATAPTSKVQTGLLLPQPLSLKRAATVVAAGLAFGLASTFRSNGILNGIPFAWEFLLTALHVLPRRPQEAVQQLAVLGLGGICVAAGSVVPQAVAYWRFCYSAKSGPRPWCQRWPPSVYAFVQSHYW